MFLQIRPIKPVLYKKSLLKQSQTYPLTDLSAIFSFLMTLSQSWIPGGNFLCMIAKLIFEGEMGNVAGLATFFFSTRYSSNWEKKENKTTSNKVYGPSGQLPVSMFAKSELLRIQWLCSKV